MSINGVGDTPSCIEMCTMEECSMFVNSVARIDNQIHEEEKGSAGGRSRERAESFLVNGMVPTFLDHGQPPSILIVDDNTFNVYSLKLVIEEAFHL